MCPAINLLQSLDAGVRIDLRRRDRRVAQELLNGAKVGARVKQVRREGMTQ